jgi:hypothetical protein
MKYDLFVDESCHLEHDKIPVMCIGYVKIPRNEYDKLKQQFLEIKKKHDVSNELKWSKFSKVRIALYKELVDYFFSTPLEFRCIIVKYKERLNHRDFNQGSHDNFYYKMIYFLLNHNSSDQEYRIFLDIKDTRGREKLNKIEEIFQNKHRGKSPFLSFQHLRSHDNLFFELTDLFIGAITYKCRLVKGDVKENSDRLNFINYLEEKSGYTLDESTVPWENKFNIFDHQPRIH